VGHRQRRRNPPFLDDEWSYREAAGGIPESAREPSPVYPAGRVGTPADPNAPPGVELSLAPPPLLGLVLLHTVRPTAMQKLRIVTWGFSGGRSLTRPFRDARRFPSTRW
jgi:hypothetical protein